MTNRRNLGRDCIVGRFLEDRKGHPKNRDVLLIRLDPDQLNDLDVFSLGTFGCVFDFETHPLTFRQDLETITGYGAIMDKNVLSAILLDETKALLLVEPLHFSFWHKKTLLLFHDSRISLNVVWATKKAPPEKNDSQWRFNMMFPKTTIQFIPTLIVT